LGETAAAAEQYNVHGQVTWLPQGYPSFPALYPGPESLPVHSSIEATFSATAFLGLGLWQGAGIVFGDACPRAEMTLVDRYWLIAQSR
jgi:hypothetical protein